MNTLMLCVGTSPHWNSSMQFLIRDVEQDILCLTVYDRDFFSPDGEDILYLERFVFWTFCLQDVLSLGRFVLRTFCLKGVLSLRAKEKEKIAIQYSYKSYIVS